MQPMTYSLNLPEAVDKPVQGTDLLWENIMHTCSLGHEIYKHALT
jgi:hypothetical protein